MTEKCSKCQKMAKNLSKINCQICRKTFHLKCCGVSKIDSETIKEKGSHWFCRNCLQAILPFQGVDNKKFSKLFKEIELNPPTKHIQKSSNEPTRQSNMCSVCGKVFRSQASVISCVQCESSVHATRSLISRHQLLLKALR